MKLMKVVHLTLFALLFATATTAQTLHIEGVGHAKDMEGFNFFAVPMSLTEQELTPLTMKKAAFSGDVPISKTGLYYLYSTNSQTQMQVPFYVQPDKQGVKLKLTFIDGDPMLNLDKNNKALSAYSLIARNHLRAFWRYSNEMTLDERSSFLKQYYTTADSIIRTYETNEMVSRYIRLWAIMDAYASYLMIPNSTKTSAEAAEKESFLNLCQPDLKLLDTDMALYFQAGIQCLMKVLPLAKGLNERLKTVYQQFKDTTVTRRLTDFIITNYITHYSFKPDSKDKLDDLQQAVHTYGLSADYVQEFKDNQKSISDKRFPAKAHLTDAAGNTVDFSSLRGFYVYIDLWASWCVPCRKEIPHLQRLENELKNPLVKFVSISIDRTESDWKKAVKQLNLHGLQWLNADNSLPKALNIRGIPFFLIYDKEGNLMQYDAPRPSDGDKLKAYLEGLN